MTLNHHLKGYTIVQCRLIAVPKIHLSLWLSAPDTHPHFLPTNHVTALVS